MLKQLKLEMLKQLKLEKLLGELRHCPCALSRKVSIHKAFLGNLMHQIFGSKEDSKLAISASQADWTFAHHL